MEQFNTSISNNKLLEGVSKVYIALSGGPDSMALLHMFKQTEDTYNIKVEAIHIHHGLREASDEEEVQVKEWCRQMNVLCHIKHVNVQAKMARGYAVEEAARLCRYEIFDAYLQEGDVRIALGHHQDDQAETILMNFLRGSGLKGLGGMLPRRGQYIRPMLTMSREDIMDYCEKHVIKYVMDESNDETIYRRNLVRHEVIPYLENHFDIELKTILGRNSHILQDEEQFIVEETKERIRQAKPIIEDGRIEISVAFILKEHPAMQRRLIRYCIELLKDSLYNIGSDHVEQIRDLLKGETGRSINLPRGIVASRDYETLKIISKQIEKVANVGELSSRIISDFNWDEFPKKPYTKWFDYDKIRGNLVVRTRSNGDYIRVGDALGKKKLKDYFMDVKLSKDLRDLVPIVADEEEVLWIIGYRMNDKYKITNKTREVLEVTYKEDSLNEW